MQRQLDISKEELAKNARKTRIKDTLIFGLAIALSTGVLVSPTLWLWYALHPVGFWQSAVAYILSVPLLFISGICAFLTWWGVVIVVESISGR